uniref:RxLR effector protein n=1 Tax=Pseudo-nitzschia australis TaxID=44445 RepID=A0A7S4ERA3_9STRA|mmetsp:Transcript_18160/g.39591  ORF Transcript_18160/g.39591 Transcript_18160/m.39591 type:complete len:127 (+) Transcript_18160:143-523(+)
MRTQTIVAVCVCFLSSSLVASESPRKRRRQRLLRIPSGHRVKEGVVGSEFSPAKESFSSHVSSQSISDELKAEMNGIDKRFLEDVSMSMSMNLRQRQRFMEEEDIYDMIRELESTVSMSMSVESRF